MNDAKVDRDGTITVDFLAQPVAVLNAGALNLKLYAYVGGEVDSDAFCQMHGPGYAQTLHVFPAGEYSVTASFGAAKIEEARVVGTNERIEMDVIIGTGLAVVEGGAHFFEVFEAKTDIEGNRKSTGYAYGAGADFDLPGSDHVAIVSLGMVKVEVPFAVKVGERVDLVATLNAGVAAFTTPGGEYMEVMSLTKDLKGNRTSFGYSYGLTWQTTLAVRGMCLWWQPTAPPVRPRPRSRSRLVIGSGLRPGAAETCRGQGRLTLAPSSLTKMALRVYLNGREAASQADDEGSIPFTRSIVSVHCRISGNSGMMIDKSTAACAMSRLSLVAAAMLVLLGLCVTPAQAKTYPFVGSWDCEGVRHDFTETGYSDGKISRTYLSVKKRKGAYVLQFEDGPSIVLVLGRSTGMAMVIGQGFIQDCRPL